MSIPAINKEDVLKYRSIVYNGKNSMTDMGLMMVGSTPLSTVTPKSLREEIAFSNGDLDLSRIDGEIYFNSREITYTFITIHDFMLATDGNRGDLYPMGGQFGAGDGVIDENDYKQAKFFFDNDYWINTPDLFHRADANANDVFDITDLTIIEEAAFGRSAVARNKALTQTDADIFNWLYLSPKDGVAYTRDSAESYAIKSTELYDYGYGDYKFVNASVEEVQVGKAMFNDIWIQQITVKFKFDPYMQSLAGSRLDIVTFADRSLTSRKLDSGEYVQAELIIFNNRSYFLNDLLQWGWSNRTPYPGSGTTSTKTWLFTMYIPYSGTVGMFIAQRDIIHMPGGDVEYARTEITGDGNILTFVNNDRPGEEIHSAPSGYFYVNPVPTSDGRYMLRFKVTYEKEWPVDDPPPMYIEWGVLRNFSVPDQNHYKLEIYTKNLDYIHISVNGNRQGVGSNKMNISLPEQPLNRLRFENPEFDALYKFYYESSKRRL